jgi:hypothetical protein
MHGGTGHHCSDFGPPATASDDTAANLLALAKRVASEAIARGCFVGEPMSSSGSCGDDKDGSWIGWDLRVWDDGRWNVVPAGRDGHPRLVMHVVLTAENIASVDALVRALLASAITVEPFENVRDETLFRATLAELSRPGQTTLEARDALLDALLAPTEGR